MRHPPTRKWARRHRVTSSRSHADFFRLRDVFRAHPFFFVSSELAFNPPGPHKAGNIREIHRCLAGPDFFGPDELLGLMVFRHQSGTRCSHWRLWTFKQDSLKVPFLLCDLSISGEMPWQAWLSCLHIACSILNSSVAPISLR